MKKGRRGVEKKKHQERFPVVIRLPISNETIPDILYEIKIAITFECQADSNSNSRFIFALKITQSSIHLIVLAFGAINLHWYTCLIVICRIYYPLFLSQKLSKLFSIVEQNCHHQHKVLTFGDMATNLVHKTEFSSKTSERMAGLATSEPCFKIYCTLLSVLNN